MYRCRTLSMFENIIFFSHNVVSIRFNFHHGFHVCIFFLSLFRLLRVSLTVVTLIQFFVWLVVFIQIGFSFQLVAHIILASFIECVDNKKLHIHFNFEENQLNFSPLYCTCESFYVCVCVLFTNENLCLFLSS